MKTASKWTIGLISTFVLAAPLSLCIWVWTDFHKARMRQQHEAEEVISQFHQRFNARDFDAICRDAFKCGDFLNLRQDWQSALEDTRNRGGGFKMIVRSNVRVVIEPPSVQANVVSPFEKGELTEVFYMRHVDSGPLQIVTYKVVAKETPASL